MFCLFNYKIIFSVLLLFLWESEKQILCFSGSVAFAIHLWWMWHPRFRIPELVMSQLGEIILVKINMSHLRSRWSSKKTKILFSVETSTERQNQELNVERLVSKSYQYSESVAVLTSALWALSVQIVGIMQQPSFQPACSSFQLFLSDCSESYLKLDGVNTKDSSKSIWEVI